MSPRIIQLPMSGRDRRHYVRELRLAEQAHARLPGRVAEAYAAAHRLACEEWNVRQFIGGEAEPSPSIADAISAGCELLDVRCKRCGHESLVDLTEVIWPRDKQIHTLAGKLCCKACKEEGKKVQPNLIGLQTRNPDPPEPPVREAKVSR
jgi:hypothetical protein